MPVGLSEDVSETGLHYDLRLKTIDGENDDVLTLVHITDFGDLAMNIIRSHCAS